MAVAARLGRSTIVLAGLASLALGSTVAYGHGHATVLVYVVERACVVKGPEMSPAELLQNFESLGNNCEFGLVQRHFGLETVGLLRWGSFPNGFAALLRALQLKLTGAELAVSLHTANNEYISHDSTFGMTFHTHKLVGEIDPDVLIRHESDRMRYLSKLLIEDVEDDAKIVVYKSTPELSAGEVGQLRDALAAIGPATLLWVTRTDRADRLGTVEHGGHRFLKGYIDDFSPEESIFARCSFDMWIRICTNAMNLWTAGRRDAGIEQPSSAMAP